jgi:radical SAM superfamily enzyme YgiQ (UPF0313 family)
MRKLKLLLISPTSSILRVQKGERPRQSRLFRFSMLPCLSVAAAMPPFVETRIVDEDVEPVDFDVDADLVGITFMTFNAPRAYEIADRFRKEKGRTVIVGGYHPTFLPEEAGMHADAVCVGDAEDAAPRMLEDFAAGALKPVYRSAFRSLDGMTPVNRSMLNRKNYAPVDVVQATRGCRYSCVFCSVAAFHQSRFRTRPIPEVIDEIRGLGRHLLFMDDNIIGDPEYAKELFAAMIPLGKRWYSQCGVELAEDPDLLRLAARSGCRGLFVGLESLSQAGLGNWMKHCNLKRDYLSAIRRLHEAGIAIVAGFVFGSDEDRPDVFVRTLEFLLDANVEALQATRMTPFPGTPLFDDLDRQGRIFDKDWSHYDFNHVVFEPLHMSPRMLDDGVGWVARKFFDRGNIARRVWRTLGYLHPATTFGGVLPLNVGYRARKSMDGDFARGRDFVPPVVQSVDA